jgi:hypothetical protein
MSPANDNGPVGAAIRFAVEPRLVPLAKAARRLHLTASQFDAKHPALAAAGFPKPCRITGHYDLKAIEAWLDRQAGIATTEVAPTQTEASRLVAQRLAAFE